MSAPRRIVVALSGASGAIYGIRALEVIRQDRSVELHAIVSSGARATIAYETDRSFDDVVGLADVVHDEKNLARFTTFWDHQRVHALGPEQTRPFLRELSQP